MGVLHGMARPPYLLIAIAAAALLGCNVGNEVDNDGQYTFLSTTHVDDLAPYPLQRLLIVEEDAETRRAYVYLFAGDLHEAGVGVQDLRRIALNYGKYQMAFDPPRSRYAEERVTGRGAPLALMLRDDEQDGGVPDGGQTFELVKLDYPGLGQSGASRWLSSVTSSDYDVRAYFGVLELNAPLGAFVIEDGKTDVEFESRLVTPKIELAIEDELLTVEYGALKFVDSLTFDLWQQIKSKEEPHTVVEAEVRTQLPPGGKYGAGKSLVTDAAGKGCWSDERPLGVRVAQLARRYFDAGGGLVVVHVKLDAVWLKPEEWTEALLAKPVFADYCKNYQ